MRKKPKVLRPVWPNAGIEAEYRRRLRALLEEVHNSVLYWVRAAYRQNEPEVTQLANEVAQDASPSAELRKIMRALTKRWRSSIEGTAKKLAKWFAKSAATRSDAALKKILKDGGFAVEFKLTPAQRDILVATIAENVSLIKSIPAQYLDHVEQLVMRSVTQGRNIGYLTKQIEKHYTVSHKRAVLIARDQNNKATSALNRARCLELGLKEAIWMHSHAGKKPRPEHVKMHGKKFNIARGMWDPHEKMYIQPGYLINCRCTKKVVIAGLT